jgi:hypothetical protein
MNTRVKGDISFSSDEDVSITANENFGGAIRMAAADHLYLDSHMYVKGSMTADGIITCDSLTAGNELGGGVFAGSFGFVSLTGGLSLGAPIAVPGSVFAIGSGTFGIKVFAPYISSLYSSTIVGGAIWQSDVLNYVRRLIHRPSGTGEAKVSV